MTCFGDIFAPLFLFLSIPSLTEFVCSWTCGCWQPRAQTSRPALARLPDLHPAACACSVCMHCMPALCACAACVHCVLGAARSQIGCSSQAMSSTRALWLHGFVLFCRASRSPLLFFAGCCCLFPAPLSGGWLAAQCLTQTSSHQAAALEVALRQDRRPQAAQYVART